MRANRFLFRLSAQITLGLLLNIMSALAIGEVETAAKNLPEKKVVTKAEHVVAKKRHPREKTYMKTRWGIEVIWVRYSAAGYMLEFRYKVLDANKAKTLFKRQNKPMLVHEKTGARMIVPTPAKTGALRNSDSPIGGKTYWMFFANPGKFIKPGEQVTIEIGDYKQEHLIVQ